MKLVIQIVLWIVIIFLGWKLYNSVIGPVKFNEVKESGKKPKLFQKKEVKSRALPDQEEKVREVKKA